MAKRLEVDDPVVCQVCVEQGVAEPYTAASIITHLGRVHGMKAKEYAEKYNAPFVAASLTKKFSDFGKAGAAKVASNKAEKPAEDNVVQIDPANLNFQA